MKKNFKLGPVPPRMLGGIIFPFGPLGKGHYYQSQFFYFTYTP